MTGRDAYAGNEHGRDNVPVMGADPVQDEFREADRPGGRPPTAGLRDVLRAPFTWRTGRELVFCLLGVGFGLAVFAVPYGLFATAYVASSGARDAAGRGVPQPAVAPGFLVGVPVALLILLVLAAPAGRVLGRIHRSLAKRLLDESITAPARPTRMGSLIRRVGSSVADGPGWRAIAYSLLKLPLGVIEAYAVFCWTVGLVNMTYPLWWRLFRNHPPDVDLSPVPVLTPFGPFRVATFAGSFAALAAGLAMVSVAPWLARGACALDRATMRGLLGPGRLDARVQQLQESRARVIDDAAATLRSLERDLHDGAQIRLATLAMNLGMATEKLGTDDPPADLAQARDLVAVAHRGAKEALAELRDLVRGIHPPVLDHGLPDALATLATASVIPVTLSIELRDRPATGIETIAYFCTTELLANAAKHSHASHIRIDVNEQSGTLILSVVDDGAGGADANLGTGLAGLAHRVGGVDGRLHIVSPVGGPTRVTVELPMQP
jgi:signal transduction histidine kinase